MQHIPPFLVALPLALGLGLGLGFRAPDDEKTLGPGAVASAPTPPTPPEAPETGPGSAEYAHAGLTSEFFGKGPKSCWLFLPDGPRPEKAPVVVFLHGWAAITPRAHGAWITHLVRRGNIVIFPRYQRILTPPREFTPNAAHAIRAALERLTEPGGVTPDLERVAFLGHSMGGVLTANLAAEARERGLPQPRALFAMQPGITETRPDGRFIHLADLSKIPADTLLLSLASDVDGITGTRDARRIYLESTRIPAENKDYLLLHSDLHGRPRLIADHSAPVAVDPRFEVGARFAPPSEEDAAWGLDALDWYGFWKPFDALCDAAFFGEHREYALGNTPEQRFMGKWSDGKPVREIDVLDLR